MSMVETKCSVDLCPCMTICPFENVLKYVGGKWKIRILCALYHDGATRYNEIKRKVNGITNTMLASSLKELEHDELIFRKQYEEMPVRVEYSLSDKGIDLLPILLQLAKWGAEKQNENSLYY